jgi:hypothetical protein
MWTNNKDIDLIFFRRWFLSRDLDNWQEIVIPKFQNADGTQQPVVLGTLFASLTQTERTLLEWMYQDKPLSGTLHATQSGGDSSVDACDTLYERLALTDWNPLHGDDPIEALERVERKVEDAELTYQQDLARFDTLTKQRQTRKQQHQEAKRLADLNQFGSNSLAQEQLLHYATTWVPPKPIKPELVDRQQMKALLLAVRLHPWYGAKSSPHHTAVPQLPVFSPPSVKVRGACIHVGLHIAELDARSSNAAVVKDLDIDRGTLGRWVTAFFTSHQDHFRLYDEQDASAPRKWHLVGLNASVDVLHSVDVGSETFDSRACGRGGSRSHVLVCSAAHTARVLADPDNHQTFLRAYPKFSIPDKNTYIEWPARVLFYVQVRYDVADRQCSITSSHVWADQTITKRQVNGVFAVVQYYKYHPKRLSWSWGPLAELFQQHQWDMEASSLVPMSAIRGKFIYGPLHSVADHDGEFDIDGEPTPDCMCVNRIPDNGCI